MKKQRLFHSDGPEGAETASVPQETSTAPGTEETTATPVAPAAGE